MSSITPTPTFGNMGSIYPNRSIKSGADSGEMGGITPTPTAEKTGSIYPNRSVRNGADSSKMVSTIAAVPIL